MQTIKHWYRMMRTWQEPLEAVWLAGNVLGFVALIWLLIEA